MTRRSFLVLSMLLVAVVAASVGCSRSPTTDATRRDSRNDEVLARAISDRSSSVQVEGEGLVIKLLPDDREGGRHQRFIIRLGSAQTLLIAHNIDQAPRVASLREGDSIEFRGEYEWNPRGGVIHWTHGDRSGRHADGWLKHKGEIYQ